MRKVCCKHTDGYGNCNIRRTTIIPFLWKVKSRCEEYHSLEGNCKDADRPQRPSVPPPPPPPTPRPPAIRIIIEGVKVLTKEENEDRRKEW